MHQGLKLVEAERASLFLVDPKTMQLYARSVSEWDDNVDFAECSESRRRWRKKK